MTKTVIELHLFIHFEHRNKDENSQRSSSETGGEEL